MLVVTMTLTGPSYGEGGEYTLMLVSDCEMIEASTPLNKTVVASSYGPPDIKTCVAPTVLPKVGVMD